MCPGIPKGRGFSLLKNAIKPCSVHIDRTHAFNIELKPSTQPITARAFQYENKDNGNDNDGSSQDTMWKSTLKVFAAAALTSIGVNEFSLRNELLAEEKEPEKEDLNIEQEIIDKENR